MSLPRPIRPYHSQANLIWWDGPFKLTTPNCFTGDQVLLIWEHVFTADDMPTNVRAKEY